MTGANNDLPDVQTGETELQVLWHTDAMSYDPNEYWRGWHGFELAVVAGESTESRSTIPADSPEKREESWKALSNEEKEHNLEERKSRYENVVRY
ncbi:Oidioi.mRNA.OKI2018_I69.chr2.g5066.t1.cds [Oikopleura dioica]|uniref:Oidioi.mRNA.OKI2018_I69.chr2.g5066.t1.cds n=1 Tax=Oikopleura dioica TaxID=34765 RepID=A0ABN7SYV8_OIKDI|nr:Oidioi.mRNA.OKI2018_I69.chr2.g5066.t1.cds [Oikopleura dioica]